ncbi:MAG: cryptochrome/photolyase family protein, partial [Beijerinckiaceae bacterium]
RTGLLMDGDKPAGGAWNFDAENRKALPKSVKLRTRRAFPPDATTRAALDLVAGRFPNNFGTLDRCNWPVTRAQALQALDDFIVHDLPFFGDYQDAMRAGAPFVFHSLLSPALNIGLLTPLEVCIAAERAWRAGQAPLPAVEGFIRQILGWREYVRGIYWHFMPDYARSNALDATRPIPDFYWTGETAMACMAHAIGDTMRHAYSHHIQRLMITGNFALLAGIDPAQVEEWYLAVYADAFEWVELPNTHGMALHADGGVMATKPYAASGAYINRMSNFCKGCRYNVAQKLGDDACPFNYLYWAFLIRHEKKLGRNLRLRMPYHTLAGWTAAQKQAYTDAADAFLDGLKAYQR